MGGLGCDNMTATIVCLLQGGTYSELAAKCSLKAVAREDTPPAREARYNNVTLSSYDGLREALYGGISESAHDFDGIPCMAGGSKLNDTLHSANTDLDNVIEINRQGMSDVKGGGNESEDIDSSSATSGLPRDSQLDMLQPIETTV